MAVHLIVPGHDVTPDERAGYLKQAKDQAAAAMAGLLSGRPSDRRRNLPEIRQVARVLREIAKELDSQ